MSKIDPVNIIDLCSDSDSDQDVVIVDNHVNNGADKVRVGQKQQEQQQPQQQQQQQQQPKPQSRKRERNSSPSNMNNECKVIFNPYTRENMNLLFDKKTLSLKRETETEHASISGIAQQQFNVQPFIPSRNDLLFSFSNNANENVIVTDGIIPLLSLYTSITASCNFAPNSVSLISTTSMLHIQQKDAWSCGYRNLQMILSAILPIIPQSHHFFQQNQQKENWNTQNTNDTTTTTSNDVKDRNLYSQSQARSMSISIPSILEIQQSFERSWSLGYDPVGAQHYRYQITNTNQKIGAAEVASYLTYNNIDNTVIEFVLCNESRSLLIPFCYYYFTNRLYYHKSTCPYCTDETITTTSYMTGQYILKQINPISTNSSNSTNTMIQPTCNCPILPLYLQWNGHSVSIIGIETSNVSNNNNNNNRNDITPIVINLLVFDPKFNGTKVKESSLLVSSSKKQTNRTAMIPSTIRLPIHKVSHKDCQIILLSNNIERSISIYEHSQYRTKNISSITAAHDAVMKLQQQLKQHGMLR